MPCKVKLDNKPIWVASQSKAKYKDYFKTNSATGLNCILFTVYFFCDIITFCYHKHKRFLAKKSWGF